MLQQSKGLDEQLKRQRREAEERDAERRAGQLGIPYLNLISLQTPTELKAMELVKEEDARKALLSPLQISSGRAYRRTARCRWAVPLRIVCDPQG